MRIGKVRKTNPKNNPKNCEVIHRDETLSIGLNYNHINIFNMISEQKERID